MPGESAESSRQKHRTTAGWLADGDSCQQRVQFYVSQRPTGRCNIYCNVFRHIKNTWTLSGAMRQSARASNPSSTRPPGYYAWHTNEYQRSGFIASCLRQMLSDACLTLINARGRRKFRSVNKSFECASTNNSVRVPKRRTLFFRSNPSANGKEDTRFPIISQRWEISFQKDRVGLMKKKKEKEKETDFRFISIQSRTGINKLKLRSFLLLFIRFLSRPESARVNRAPL